jgi:dimethylamine/trimethylamine dehydrogenase
VRGLKQLTSKPVVGVGRFTSPETMVRMIRRQVLDFIGAARPSIADPFLPAKIAEGRADEIRECIGCNLCVSGDYTTSPIRCTQNPSMGEEWRRGWHPERFRPVAAPTRVLVVGAGPAGLEAAVAAGKRGCEVVLIEATRELGGRVAREARLPGLAAWRRVLDYRQDQLRRLPAVDVYRQSAMTADEILEHPFGHIAVATGSTWRRDGVGYHHPTPMEIDPSVEVLTPDDLMNGSRPNGRGVALFDDDHYYLGGVLAELLANEGYQVTLITPAADVSDWTHHTLEQHRIAARLLGAGVEIITHRSLERIGTGGVTTACVFTGRTEQREVDAVVLVTSRLPNEQPVLDLLDRCGRMGGDAPRVRAVGDASAPGTIAAAVWDGRRFAEELEDPDPGAPFRRDLPTFEIGPPGS